MVADSVARLSRMLALVPWLNTQGVVTFAEAAQHFGVTPEQIRRDLRLLVTSEFRGQDPGELIDIYYWEDDDDSSPVDLANGEIHVKDAQALTRPLRLSIDESVPLLIGLRQLEAVPGEHDRAVLHSTIDALQSLMADFAQVGEPTEHLVIEQQVDPQVMDAINAALAADAPLELEYLAASNDSVRSRIVQIQGIRLMGGNTYLDAYCHTALGQRQFRLDRVMGATVRADLTGTLRAPDVPLAGGLESSPPTEPTIARIRIRSESRWLLDLYGLDTAATESTDVPGLLEVDWPIWQSTWLIRLALELGGHLEILSPASWRAEVVAQARAALADSQ